MVVRGIFTVAVEQDVVSRSPVRDSHMPVIQKREKPVWSPDQVRSIIQSAPAPFRALIALVGLTGVRLGELLALQWKHVEFQSGYILIAQSLYRGQLMLTKTEGSVRKISLGPLLAAIMEEHFQNSMKRDANDFVFCKSDGSPHDPDVVRKDVLYRILDRLGIERIPRQSGFHSFRHSAGSFINDETGNLKLAQKLLGHTQLSTTADIYTHNLPEAERRTSEALEKAVFGNPFPVVPKTGTGNKIRVQ
jgi:integrase